MDDLALVDALRRGDEAAYAALADRYGALMTGLALRHVRSAAVAEDVVQDTWLGVLEGIDRFEMRSTLKTWLLAILVNCALSRARREGRAVPLSALPAEPAAGRASDPETAVLAREAVAAAGAALRTLPERQRRALVLRDVAGWSAGEVAGALGVSDGNERVLLHRARTTVRAALEHAA